MRGKYSLLAKEYLLAPSKKADWEKQAGKPFFVSQRMVSPDPFQENCMDKFKRKKSACFSTDNKGTRRSLLKTSVEKQADFFLPQLSSLAASVSGEASRFLIALFFPIGFLGGGSETTGLPVAGAAFRPQNTPQITQNKRQKRQQTNTPIEAAEGRAFFAPKEPPPA